MNKRKIYKSISLLLIICFTFIGCKVSDKEQKAHFVNGLIQFKEKDKWGFMDINENIVIPAEYDEVEVIDEGYIFVELDGRSALLSPEGELLTEFYDDYLLKYDGENHLLPVHVDEKIGYINFEGEMVIEPIFRDARGFKNGLARVDVDIREVGVINVEGDYVVEPIYDSIIISDTGYIYCKENFKWKILDREGELVIDAEYDNIIDFTKEGYGIVGVKHKKPNEAVSYHYGLINKRGKYVIEPIYDDMYFSNNEDYIVFSIDNKYGLFDYEGNIILEPIYDFIDNFNEGFAIIEKDDKYGYINKKGEVVIEPTYYMSSEFHEGLASFIQDDKMGYINKKGEVIVEPVYDFADYFYNGLARVEKDNRVGYINTSGEVIIPLEYLDGSFCDDEGYIVVAMTNEKFTIINKNNEKLLKKEYDCLSDDMENISFCIEKQCSEKIRDYLGYCYDHKFEKGYCVSYGCENKQYLDSKYCSKDIYYEKYD